MRNSAVTIFIPWQRISQCQVHRQEKLHFPPQGASAASQDLTAGRDSKGLKNCCFEPGFSLFHVRGKKGALAQVEAFGADLRLGSKKFQGHKTSMLSTLWISTLSHERHFALRSLFTS